MTSELPFLVVYGGYIWPVALIAVVVLTGIGLRLFRPKMARGKQISRSLIFGIVGFCATAWLVGTFAEQRAYKSKPHLTNEHLVLPVWQHIAATMPFHRSKALRGLSYDLAGSDAGPLQNTSTANARIHAAALQGDCVETASVAFRVSQWARAQALAEACDDEGAARLLVFIHWARGNFLEASKLAQMIPVGADRSAGTQLSWKQAAMIHLFAGDYKATAEAIDKGVELLPANTADMGFESEYERVSFLRATGARLGCLAAASRETAGIPAFNTVEMEGADCRTLEELFGSRRAEEPSDAKPAPAFAATTYFHDLDHFVSPTEISAFYCSQCPSPIVSSPHLFDLGVYGVGSDLVLLGAIESTYNDLKTAKSSPRLRATIGIQLALQLGLAGEAARALEILNELEPNKEIPFQVFEYLVLKAALAKKVGNTAEAHDQLNAARQIFSPSETQEYFAKFKMEAKMFASLQARLEKSAFAHNVPAERRTMLGVLRSGAPDTISISYPLIGTLEFILTAQKIATEIGDEDWLSELEPARQSWIAALRDRNRSLLLSALRQL